MKKFSISQLEGARTNPTAFGNILKEGGRTKFFGRSKSMRWLDSVCEYHKDNNLSDAINYLIKSFSHRADNRKNKQEIDKLIFALENYVQNYLNKQFSSLRKRATINIEITKVLRISGYLPIIYERADGFSIYFFSHTSHNWINELKFPITQEYAAKNIFNCDLSQVETGVIDIFEGTFSENCFTSEEVEEAYRELNQIGTIISNILS